MATKANSKGNAKASSKGNAKASSKAGPGKAQKKGRSSGRTTSSGQSVQSQRYTPPVPKSVKTSSRWHGVLILAMFLLGVLIVILNYAGLLRQVKRKGEAQRLEERARAILASRTPPPDGDATGPISSIR